jgi:hypothetical protein
MLSLALNDRKAGRRVDPGSLDHGSRRNGSLPTDFAIKAKSNTSKRRTHSLFWQGRMLYDLIPTMPDKRLLPLIEKFGAMLAEVPVFANTFGAV